jgi:hypothetical protein
MKKLSLALLAVTLAFFSCKKDSTSSTPTSSQWTIDSKTYTAQFTGVSSLFGFTSFSGTDASGNDLNITFDKSTLTAGTYTVSDAASDSTQVTLTVAIGSTEYSSTGKAGDKINVTISGGKATATLANAISVSADGGTTVKTVTGTLIQD